MSLRSVLRSLKRVSVARCLTDLVRCIWVCQRQCPVLRVVVETYIYSIEACAKREEWTFSLAWVSGGLKRV